MGFKIQVKHGSGKWVTIAKTRTRLMALDVAGALSSRWPDEARFRICETYGL